MNLSVIESSEFFDKNYYVKTYTIPEHIPPAEHYLKYGYKLCYNPSEKFSTSGYYFLNKDVLKAGVNPLLHYEITKAKENRKWVTDEEVIDSTVIFDPYFYITENLNKYDVSENEAVRHYLSEGWKNGLSVSDTVSLDEYCTSLPDETKKCVPLLHYIIFGCVNNGINVTKDTDYKKNIKIIETSTFFDKKFYCKEYGVGKKLDSARHYYEYGAKRFYDPSQDFSTLGYISENKISSNENALVHYEKNILNGDVYRVSNRMPFSGTESNIINLSGRSSYKISGREEKLLELILKYSEAQRNDYLRCHFDRFFVYELSELRANSVEWIPISNSKNVLVIGAGYGEIVSTLAQKSNSITCFDSEISKTLINITRNSGYDNVMYYVADVADTFYQSLNEKKFDYVFIVGALENAAKYYPEEKDPQLKMIEQAKAHLTKNGIIVLAFDNTYAIKYFNGSLRGDSGRYFDTITSTYEENDRQTFTKREIENYLGRLGLSISRTYYPFPDYHIPFAIYTDNYSVKGGEIGEPDYVWEQGKIRLFEEKKAYAAASARGCLDMFSNSFILTIVQNSETTPQKLNDIIYVKYSNDRNEAFRIRTEIRESEDGIKTVCKIPLSKFSKNHIKKIYNNYLGLSEKYSDDRYCFNVCQYDGYKTEFEFLDGELLYDRVVQMIVTEDYDAVFSELDKLYDMLNRNSVYFIPSRKFKEVFGSVSLPGELKACTIGDVDLILQNIMIDSKGKYNILDYEWTFNFPIPVLYILFRSIMYLSIDASDIMPRSLIEQLYSRYGLTDEIIKEFTKMENSFQKYVLLGHIPMRQFNKKGQIELFRKPIQIFEDKGDGFGTSLMRRSGAVLGPDGIINAKIFIDDGVKRLRVDPCSEKCIVKVIKAVDSDGNSLDYKTNGRRFGSNCLFFRTSDPNIIFSSLNSVISPQKILDKTNYIDICLEITTFTEQISKSI